MVGTEGGVGGVTAIVQARVSSTRLPGKVLLGLAGAPMLQRQLERVARSSLITNIVVATSTDPSDDPIVELCSDLGIDVYRGDLNNVLARFIGAIDTYGIDTAVRITADCPLISPSVIDAVIAEFMDSDVDYLSNTLQPSYPDGVDIEVFRASLLKELATGDLDSAEREHVTLGVYRRPDSYAVANFAGASDLSSLRWTVDSPEDFGFVTWVYAELFAEQPTFDIPEILDLLERHPDRSRVSGAHAHRNAALDGLDTGAMSHRSQENPGLTSS